jgi:hypothetical protein
MSPTRLGRQIAEDMDYLIGAWPFLVALGVPGTDNPRRPHRRPSEEQRARAALEAMQERIEARMPGYVRGTGPIVAPVPIALLDLLSQLVGTVAEVCDTVTQTAGVERPPQPVSSWTDPRPYLQAARAWLSVAAEADERTEPWVAGRLHPLADAVASHLGEVHDGQTIEALCPWCGGRTDGHPNGGELTLVVYARQSRLEQASMPTEAAKVGAERAEGPVIVCRGVNCSPPPSHVGVWVGEQPAWPEREWAWLSDQIRPLEGRVSC